MQALTTNSLRPLRMPSDQHCRTRNGQCALRPSTWLRCIPSQNSGRSWSPCWTTRRMRCAYAPPRPISGCMAKRRSCRREVARGSINREEGVYLHDSILHFAVNVENATNRLGDHAFMVCIDDADEPPLSAATRRHCTGGNNKLFRFAHQGQRLGSQAEWPTSMAWRRLARLPPPADAAGANQHQQI
jgi:hypothetical protein